MADTIRAKELKEQLNKDQGPRVIDVRDGDAYAKGHIPGSMNIPLPRVKTGPGHIPTDRPVVLYSSSGDPTEALPDETLRILREEGLKVTVLEGGLKSWVDSGFPLEKVDNKLYDDRPHIPDSPPGES